MDKWNEKGLGNTGYSESIGFSVPYTYLAEKIIKKYPSEQYPELNALQERILRERSLRIEKTYTYLDEDRKTQEVKETRPNEKKYAKDTPWEATTVW